MSVIESMMRDVWRWRVNIQSNIWNYCSSFSCSIDWLMLTPKLKENVKKYYYEFDSRIKICVVPLTNNIVQLLKNCTKHNNIEHSWTGKNFICFRLSEKYSMKYIFWTSAILTLGLNLVICLPTDEIIGKLWKEDYLPNNSSATFCFL